MTAGRRVTKVEFDAFVAARPHLSAGISTIAEPPIRYYYSPGDPKPIAWAVMEEPEPELYVREGA